MENNNLNHNEEYIEIDLREYIRTLWNNKWIIIVLVIIAILTAGVYSKYITKPKYQARATLLILPSTYKTSLELDTLPIDTYRSLAVTDSIKNKIIKEVDLRDEEGNLYSPSYLNSMLSLDVQINEQTNNDQSYQAPVIHLKVIHEDPELAAEIANSWSNNFMNDTRELRQSEVREVNSVITEQFNDTQEKLKNAKEKLKSFKEEVRLDVMSSELNSYKSKLDGINKKLIDLKEKLGSQKSKKDYLIESLDKKEVDGKWINDSNIEMTKKVNNSNLNKNDLEIKNNFYDAQNKLNMYLKNHNINILNLRISNLENDLKKFNNKYTQLLTKYNEINNKNKEVNSLLVKEPKTWNLNRSISSDELWNYVLNENQLEAINNLKLQNEIINPIYKDLKQKLTDNNIIINSYQAQIDFYKNKIISTENELAELNIQKNEWQTEISRLKNDINKYKKVYENNANIYVNLKNNLQETNQEIRSLEYQISFYQSQKSNMINTINNIQSNVWTAQIKKDELEQNVKDLQKTYNMLSTKVEEARLTQAEKTGDVRFIAEAIPPTNPININTKLNVAIAAVLALFAGIFIIFFKEFMKEE